LIAGAVRRDQLGGQLIKVRLATGGGQVPGVVARRLPRLIRRQSIGIDEVERIVGGVCVEISP
jgi:hypothetical protein